MREGARERMGPQLARWGLGGMVALVLHGGLALPLVLDWGDPPAPPQGVALVVDLSMISASVAATAGEPTPEPPEEEVIEEEPEPEPPPPEPEPEPEPEPPPPEPELPPEPEPEVVPEVALPEPEPEKPPPPPQVKPKVKPVEPPPRREVKPKPRPAPPVTKQIAVEAPEAAKQTAAAKGMPNRPSRQQVMTWEAMVFAALARVQRYPDSARRRGREGTVRVRFGVGPNGEVTFARLEGSSGVDALDEEALAMLRRVSPLPPPPGGRETNRLVPIVFDLKRR